MRPVFPDYICVSYDYATTRAFLLTLIFFDVITSSPLSFLFGSLPFRLSLDLFFFYIFLFFILPQVIFYLLFYIHGCYHILFIILRVYFLILRRFVPFHFLRNFVPRFILNPVLLFSFLCCLQCNLPVL